jgi:FMN phosphatase YigB (HAD superfamily)
LAKKYELGVISNFCGNLLDILEEFDLRKFFRTVTESYYAGCAKPDMRIFTIALAKVERSPAECLFIGDNPERDVAPAKAIGMTAVLIHAPNEAPAPTKTGGADHLVDSLDGLAKLLL